MGTGGARSRWMAARMGDTQWRFGRSIMLFCHLWVRRIHHNHTGFGLRWSFHTSHTYDAPRALSPGDYAAFKFPPTSRHERREGTSMLSTRRSEPTQRSKIAVDEIFQPFLPPGSGPWVYPACQHPLRDGAQIGVQHSFRVWPAPARIPVFAQLLQRAVL